MMKTFFLTLLLLPAIGGTAAAQSLETFKRRLADSAGPGRVEIREAPDAAAAFAAASRSAAEKRHEGWRITLFVNNGQNARAEAEEVVRSFEESFPDQSVDMFYDNPYFKVTAGRCATSEEAIMLLERVRAKFPKAFLTREAMSAVDLLEKRSGAGEGKPTETDEAATSVPTGSAARHDEDFL